jgi:hypothetical protein
MDHWGLAFGTRGKILRGVNAGISAFFGLGAPFVPMRGQRFSSVTSLRASLTVVRRVGGMPPPCVEVAPSLLEGIAARNMQRFSILVLGALLSAFTVDSALAACPNQCTLRVEEAKIEPPIDCITLYTPGPQDCDCKLTIHVYSSCSEPIVANQFTFDRCGEEFEDCSEIPPGGQASISVPLNEVGTEEHVFEVQIGEISAEITATTEVKEFQEAGCSCAVPGRGSASHPWVALLFVGAAWIVTRRLRRTKGMRP